MSSRARRGRHAALVLLAVAALGLAACEPEAYVGPTDGPRLAMVGDSLTVGLHDAAVDRFTGEGFGASVTGEGGYTLRDHGDTIKRAVAMHPDVMVVELGTNDVREINAGLQTYESYLQNVRDTLTMVQDVSCVVWVSVETTNGWWGPDGDMKVVGPWINTITNYALSTSGRPAGSWLIADWSSASKGRPDYFAGPNSVHHSESGNAAYLDLIDRTVAQCPAPRVIGSLDAVSASDGSVRVAGWATTTRNQQAWVRVEVDGVEAMTGPADSSRPDVPVVLPRLGADRGILLLVPVAAGPHTVCVVAGAPGAGPDLQLGCRSVTVPPAPPSTTSTTGPPESSTTTTTAPPDSTSTTTTTGPPESSTTTTTATALPAGSSPLGR